MVDKSFRNRKIVSVTTVIFQDGGQAEKFRRKMFRRCLKTITLAIQKLKLIANRIIFDRYMVHEIFRIRKIVSVMMTTFQNGGQTVNYRSKRYKGSIEGLHL